MAQHIGARPVDDRSLSELFKDLTSELQGLVRKEVELAKIETKEQVSKASKAGAMFAGAGVAAFVALLLLSFAAAWGLAAVLPTGVAFLIVGVLYLVGAAVLASVGKKAMATFKPVPEQTMKTVKDTVQVAKTSLARGASSPPGLPPRRS